jgi:hypothetical protein
MPSDSIPSAFRVIVIPNTLLVRLVFSNASNLSNPAAIHEDQQLKAAFLPTRTPAYGVGSISQDKQSRKMGAEEQLHIHVTQYALRFIVLECTAIGNNIL